MYRFEKSMLFFIIVDFNVLVFMFWREERGF